jgi:outer membrane protein assembly factor BamB
MPPSHLLLAGALIVASASPLAAQQTAAPAPGARIRVTTTSGPVEGTVVEVSGDTLRMVQHEADSRIPQRGAVPMTLPLASVTDIVTLIPPAAPPIGATIEIESATLDDKLVGTVLAVGNDSLVLEAGEPEQWRGDTVTVALWSVSKLKVTESAPLWSYRSEHDIEEYTIIDWLDAGASDGRDETRPILLIRTEHDLTCLDPVTGETLWKREDPLFEDFELWPLDLQHGLLVMDDYFEVFDLATGELRWDTGTLGVERAKERLSLLRHAPARDLLLIREETEENPSVLVAVDIESGELKWRQESLFTEPGRMKRLAGQWPLMDTDTTFVLYVSKDGPIRLHAETGDLLWRAASLDDRDVPNWWEGYADILHEQGVLYVPSEKGVTALDASDGGALWDSIPQLRSRPVQMELTHRGLLIRGADWKDGLLNNKPFLSLLDPSTGASLWPAEFRDFKTTTDFIIAGDAIFLASEHKLLAVSLVDGTARQLTDFDFENDEAPQQFQMLDDGFSLASVHNVMFVAPDGEQRFHDYYPAPGASFWETLQTGLSERPVDRPGTGMTALHTYVYTKAHHASDLEGYSLVKIRLGTGLEEGRIWLDERNPAYLVDPAPSTIYYKRDDKELEAFSFVDRDALAYAARNGYAAMVTLLLDRGADVNASAENGWTALSWSASRGLIEIARELLDGGAHVNPVADEVWTPWMLAARSGHVEVVQVLRDAGADYNEPVAVLLEGWFLATQGQIPEALAAYAEAQALDSTRTVGTPAWNTLCWNGAIWNHAADVMTACDLAVAGDPEDGSIREGRAVARALTGDFEGAIEDLEVFVAWTGSDAQRRYRERWIRALRAGENPFTEEVLEALRRS